MGPKWRRGGVESEGWTWVLVIRCVCVCVCVCEWTNARDVCAHKFTCTTAQSSGMQTVVCDACSLVIGVCVCERERGMLTAGGKAFVDSWLVAQPSLCLNPHWFKPSLILPPPSPHLGAGRLLGDVFDKLSALSVLLLTHSIIHSAWIAQCCMFRVYAQISPSLLPKPKKKAWILFISAYRCSDGSVFLLSREASAEFSTVRLSCLLGLHCQL